MATLFLFFTVLQDTAPTLNFSDFNHFLSCSKLFSIPPVLRPFPLSGPPCTPKFSTWPVGLSAETFTVSPSDPQEKSNLSFHTSPLDSPTLFEQKMKNSEIVYSCCHQEEVTGHQCVTPGKTALLKSEEVTVPAVSVPVPPCGTRAFPRATGDGAVLCTVWCCTHEQQTVFYWEATVCFPWVTSSPQRAPELLPPGSPHGSMNKCTFASCTKSHLR